MTVLHWKQSDYYYINLLHLLSQGPQWLVWSSWQECSATCGTSIQYRTRACLTEDHSKTCEGKFLDLRECSVNPCPHETVSNFSLSRLIYYHLWHTSKSYSMDVTKVIFWLIETKIYISLSISKSPRLAENGERRSEWVAVWSW